jgi:hypothetical protein
MSKVSRFGFAVQADIVVNIDPDQLATLFCSSDGLTRQQVIDQLKIEHGDGVLKQGPITLPPHPTVLPPGTYTFKRRVSPGEEVQIAASIVYAMLYMSGTGCGLFWKQGA